MSQTESSVVNDAAMPHKRTRWLHEPLLHFALVGALLFGADRLLIEQVDDPNTIVVGSAVADEARRLFRESRGRDPNAEELAGLTRRWVDNEILYREGLALGVDQGDNMIRERVIFKSLMVVESGLKLPPIDDQALRAWFETQRAKYDEPARYDFQEAVLAADTPAATVQAFVVALNQGAPGDTNAGLRVFKGRPHANLVQSYGADFAQTLEAGPVGQWRALPTREGLRVMRLDAVVPAQAAQFEALRNAVLADWTDATMARLRTDAVRLRGQKYTVKFEGQTS
ncbi:MAG: peptidylprolyl isomerase [Rubrivivax sp.]|nr:peptidylprolyl isomerase [Rubrivivax sp.]